jgi:hypothetical protein
MAGSRSLVLEGFMRHADSKPITRSPQTQSPQSPVRAVPTFIATDLLEKLIEDRDAQAVRKVVTQSRRD